MGWQESSDISDVTLHIEQWLSSRLAQLLETYKSISNIHSLHLKPMYTIMRPCHHSCATFEDDGIFGIHVAFAGNKGQMLVMILTRVDTAGRLVVNIIAGGLSARSLYSGLCGLSRSCHLYGLSAWILTVGLANLVFGLVRPDDLLFR